MKIKKATLDDMKYIVSLSQKENHAIGFIPKTAYEAAIIGKKPSKHRWSDTCNDKIFMCYENGDPVGFVMMSYGKIAKVNQICIQEDARLLERGKALLKGAVDVGLQKGIYRFGCGCADDLESNRFWSAMGWEKTSQRNGMSYHNTWRQTSDRKINIYRYYANSLLEELK